MRNITFLDTCQASLQMFYKPIRHFTELCYGRKVMTQKGVDNDVWFMMY
jgi:hypothetical protein